MLFSWVKPLKIQPNMYLVYIWSFLSFREKRHKFIYWLGRRRSSRAPSGAPFILTFEVIFFLEESDKFP